MARSAVQQAIAGPPPGAALSRTATTQRATTSSFSRADVAAPAYALGSASGTRAAHAGPRTPATTAPSASKAKVLSLSCDPGGTAARVTSAMPLKVPSMPCRAGNQVGRSANGTSVRTSQVRKVTTRVAVIAGALISPSGKGLATRITQGNSRGGPFARRAPRGVGLIGRPAPPARSASYVAARQGLEVAYELAPVPAKVQALTTSALGVASTSVGTCPGAGEVASLVSVLPASPLSVPLRLGRTLVATSHQKDGPTPVSVGLAAPSSPSASA